MSSTNKTTNYELPIFASSDSPKWLVDWNGAMTAIDSAIYQAKQLAETAGASASAVAADLASLASTVSAQGTSISTLVDSLTTLTGTVNTITSLIGNGEPTTTDKTIIGAINELNAKAVNASAVGYDNTISGLNADDAQDAIDENAAAIANLSEEPDLLASSTDTNFETVTLPTGKKFSDYRLVIVAELINNTLISSCVPRNVFTTTTNGIISSFLDSNNIQTRATAKYVSDTSADLKTGTGGTCLLYGVK